MKKINLLTLMIAVAISFSSCQAIAGIFKAGMWTGFLIVAIIIIAIIWLISRASSRK